jgi:hypothetical protein
MWPTLEIGSTYQILTNFGRRARSVMLVGITDTGDLQLAVKPATPRGRWRPLEAPRRIIRGVFGPTA